MKIIIIFITIHHNGFHFIRLLYRFFPHSLSSSLFWLWDWVLSLPSRRCCCFFLVFGHSTFPFSPIFLSLLALGMIVRAFFSVAATFFSFVFSLAICMCVQSRSTHRIYTNIRSLSLCYCFLFFVFIAVVVVIIISHTLAWMRCMCSEYLFMYAPFQAAATAAATARKHSFVFSHLILGRTYMYSKHIMNS